VDVWPRTAAAELRGASPLDELPWERVDQHRWLPESVKGHTLTNYATGSGAAPTRSPPATTARSGSEQAYAPQGAGTLDSYWDGVANGALHCGPRNIWLFMHE